MKYSLGILSVSIAALSVSRSSVYVSTLANSAIFQKVLPFTGPQSGWKISASMDFTFNLNTAPTERRTLVMIPVVPCSSVDQMHEAVRTF